MGLDMWVYATRVPPSAPTDFEVPDDREEVHYWRKHPNLHGFMEQLYKTKGGKSEELNVTPLELVEEDLDELERAIKGEHMPTTAGFFFGQSSGDETADDLVFIAEARQRRKDGWNIFYYCWW